MSVTEAVKQIKVQKQLNLNKKEIIVCLTNFVLGVLFI